MSVYTKIYTGIMGFLMIILLNGSLCSKVSKEELVDLGNQFVGQDPHKLDSIAGLLASLANDDADNYNLSIVHSFDRISSAMQGDLGPSLQSFQESWKYAVSLNDTNLQVNALINMAGVYPFAGQPNKVKEKLNKALDLLKGEGQMQTRANTLLVLGIIPFKRSKISVLLETLV